MISWDSVFEWGRRASDRLAPAPITPKRDPLLESVIAHEQIDVLYQPQIEPVTGRILGAEALARSAVSPSAQALFERATAAGLDERLSRLVQRKALRSAAGWEGPLKGLKLSINLLPEDISREGYDQWLLDEADAAGLDPKRLTVEITENALLVDQQAVAASDGPGHTAADRDGGSGNALQHDSHELPGNGRPAVYCSFLRPPRRPEER